MPCETLALPAEGGLRPEVWMLLPNARMSAGGTLSHKISQKCAPVRSESVLQEENDSAQANASSQQVVEVC